MNDDELCGVTLHEMLHWAGEGLDNPSDHDKGYDRTYSCGRYCGYCNSRGPDPFVSGQILRARTPIAPAARGPRRRRGAAGSRRTRSSSTITSCRSVTPAWRATWRAPRARGCSLCSVTAANRRCSTPSSCAAIRARRAMADADEPCPKSRRRRCRAGRRRPNAARFGTSRLDRVFQGADRAPPVGTDPRAVERLEDTDGQHDRAPQADAHAEGGVDVVVAVGVDAEERLVGCGSPAPG